MYYNQSYSIMRRFILWPALAVALVCCIPHSSSTHSPPISVSIRATWPEPPLLIQIIESAAIEHPESFFPILTALSEHWPSGSLELKTDQAIYEEALREITSNKPLNENGARESLEMSIALKEATPKIEAFRSWYASLDLKHIQSDQLPDHECKTWAYVDNRRFCDVVQLQEYLSLQSDRISTLEGPKTRAPSILPFDHVSPPEHSALHISIPVVILYASDDPRSFGPFHLTLYEASQASPPKAVYVFRWQVSSPSASVGTRKPSYLSGWSAGLDIKKSDYLTVDDRPLETSQKSSGDPISKSNEGHNEDDSSGTPLGLLPLKADEMSQLGLKVTQHIMSSPQPIHTLRVLCEDFPRHAHALVNDWVSGDVNPDLANELALNVAQGTVSEGQSSIWMNGLDVSSVFSRTNINSFKLLQLMRDERKWMDSLISLGLTPLEVTTLATDEEFNSALAGDSESQSAEGEIDPNVLGERFDASDRQEGGGAIIWLNDLERDERYSSWPTNLRDLLRPTFPGQLPPLARNTVTVILALNLTNVSHMRTLTDVVEPLITRKIPIRWGLVPIDSKGPLSAEKESVLHTMWHAITSYGPTKTLQFVNEVIESITADVLNAEKFQRKSAAYFAAHAMEDLTAEDGKASGVESSDQTFHTWMTKAQAYLDRLALCSTSETTSGCMLINGKFFPVDDNFRMHLQQTAMLHIQFLQHQVYYNSLKADADVAHYLYDLPGVHPARNEFVFPSPSSPLKFVNLVSILKVANLGRCSVLFESSANTQKSPSTSTIWIVGNLDSDSGASAVLSSLESLASSKSSPFGAIQLGVVHVPPGEVEADPQSLSESLAQLIRSPDKSGLKIDNVIKGIASFGIKPNRPFPSSFTLRKSHPEWQGTNVEGVWSGSLAFSEELRVTPGSVAVVFNGRVLEVPQNKALTGADIRMLLEYENQKRTVPLQTALLKILGSKAFKKARAKLPFIASVIYSTLLPPAQDSSEIRTGERRTQSYASRKGTHSSISYGDRNRAMFVFGVIMDPASELAQPWSALLETLSHRSDVAIKIWFNPHQTVEELPIKRFFRTSVDNRIKFDEAGSIIIPSVQFRNMPTDVLLTLAVETSPAWLALPLESVHDLDNIMLSKLGQTERESGVDAVFLLEHIIVAGHAKELPNGAPPRGLQVELTNVLTLENVDTIIMANLGYFQFKATPGIFSLSIRSGRSSELYSLETLNTNANSASKDNPGDGQQFALTTFDGLVLFPGFLKKPGKEEERLIEPVASTPEPAPAHISPPGIVKFVDQLKAFAGGIFGSKIDSIQPVKQPSGINVFTVASGLLYERMAYLMCVSVMRHTKSRVKFWFISNFLSPSFKRFIPHLAHQYGFDYQMVTYRWPPWLRAQKEKQRVIWGYKILFLDVLFPLELERVIFVDSDQIVRTDLQALVDLDMRGAPYGYTPMCGDRSETQGYRFWDTGYWKESLQGKPYHISALYVVDLRVFRAIAAGDQLRQHYQALSADPNSLANLDQDLPNNMQSALPIFSLDQSWLWCETWCSDEGLKTAKTIDLCNNPMTHEPKLTRARRLIPEWNVYDREVAELTRRLRLERKILGGELLDQTGSQSQEGDTPKDEL